MTEQKKAVLNDPLTNLYKLSNDELRALLLRAAGEVAELDTARQEAFKTSSALETQFLGAGLAGLDERMAAREKHKKVTEQFLRAERKFNLWVDVAKATR